MPVESSRGQGANRPTEIPARGWKDILWRVYGEITTDHVSVVAAGVAFFGLLAIFPAVTALISIAGYVLDPADVADQINTLAAVLPENAATVVRDQILTVTGGSEAATGFAAILGLLFALYGAMKGMTTLMEGMNIAYDEEDTRSLVVYYATALALTLFLIFGLLVSIGATIVLPNIIGFFGLPPFLEAIIAFVKWPLLALLAIFGLAVVYRFGPSRAQAKWRWVSPGALVATALWLVGTLAFSIYAQNFTDYNETYGTLGGVILLMTWFWLSAFIVLLGAELNAEMEHQTREDTTAGAAKPLGSRGAVVADTKPEDLGVSDRGAPKPARSEGRDDNPRRSRR